MADETTNGCGDFFAALVQDHQRIELQLKMLVQAADALSGVESKSGNLDVIARVLEFFATNGARHEEVEELTLFPRLRSGPEFKQILSALEFQHRMNRVADQELRACVDRFTHEDGREMRRLAIRFAEMNRGHAVAEERALFPLAASVLTPRVIADMSREMLERKSVVSPTGAGKR